ncbi:MAG: OmpA family protein [Rhodospirillales bacterium]|nr:OmpA family protein [Rhodospirillales bacterium]
MRCLIASLIAAPLALGAVPVLAQNNPSADQIIQSLKPSGDLLNGNTRGIRLADPNAAATPQAAATPAAASAPTVNLSVEFASGSAVLTPQARQTLDQLGRALASQDLAGYRFRIEGHTDTVGAPDTNKALSQRRAEAVAAYLVKNFGIRPARLQSIGMGQEGLAVPTPPQTANAQNRRVKVVNLGA